ncbi:esterase/lipase family protein [Salisaeta longa]|uniref:esterase/lipase family protein n=1 Tax=Salisaeta longa TaxID=503170 RepID=UPI00040139B9|nr:lipase [Salisaeta longa]
MANLTSNAVKRWAGLDSRPQPPVIPVRHPVVLMHGFGIGGAVRRGGHLHTAAMHLRSRGVRAFAPNVPPYSTVKVRTQIWEQHLTHILEALGATRCTLVAHSMGGLDARYLIHAMGWHAHVDVLVTVATPHRGSSVASFILEQPPAVRGWIGEMADWLGAQVSDHGPANALQSIRELTPEHIQEAFNPEVPNHPSVTYWSYAGAAGRGTDVPVDPVMRVLNAYLYDREGLNDGLVSIESAQWGDFRGTLAANHAQQVGLDRSLGKSAFEANAFYAEVAQDLAAAGH